MDQWVWDNFQFLVPHIVDVQRRNVVSFKSKIPTSNASLTSQQSTDAGILIATCLPSNAPNAWGTFHCFSNRSDIVFHSSIETGHAITSSLYAATMALHTVGTILQIDERLQRNAYDSDGYLSPVARCLRTSANCNPGKIGSRNLVLCFSIIGNILCRISSNKA
ncbi:hypothetical protein DPMN_138391 [Dreissena polymorpha]|uniref:Uncharacterized protein n=1 Tax=Dreissena polymorpha TaxID=45954 RepID=A0A9D4G3R4_DREPO|nr:hypothetical protein DPMN_138391 [Dreissena polymorpha]